MSTHTVIGRSVPSLEGPAKIAGAGQFAIDARLPGMLWARSLRSPYPHARIVSVDTTRALALPGVHAVITGDDVRGMRTGNTYRDEPVIAWDEVRYVGDKVAAVCAIDNDTAERALALIDVVYEELPALLTAADSMREGAPLIHPEFETYEGITPLDAPSNAYGHVVKTAGDIAQGFAEADVIVERTYETPRTHQLYLEPHTSLVDISLDGTAQLWHASGTPGPDRDEVARAAGISPDHLVLNFSLLGGSYGGKTDGANAILCYLLAQRTGRPVKFVADYTEELTAMHPRTPSIIHIKAGAKRNGTLTAWEAKIEIATGAYAAYTLVPADGGILVTGVAGPYRTPNVRIDSYQVYTHTIACGYARAPGPLQCAFACESHIDVIAAELGISPVAIRERNIIRSGDEVVVTGAWHPAPGPDDTPAQTVRLSETLRRALDAAHYDAPKPPNVGRGVAITVAADYTGDGHASIRVDEDGVVTMGMPNYGPGMDSYTMLAQVIAQELGVPIERIVASPWSSAQGPTDSGIGGDRGTRVTTIVGKMACDDLKRQFVGLGAELLGWADSAVEGGALVNAATGECQPLAAIAAQAGHAIEVRADIDGPGDTRYATFNAHVAEVSVDPETGQLRVLNYVAAQETGVILNPVGFLGQIYGGFSQGLGHSLTEELPLDAGHPVIASLADYKIPTIGDMPPMQAIVIKTDQGEGPYHTRGIGNKSISLPAPAIANAIADACGARITQTPFTAERIYHALRATEGNVS